jgi:hypothetical protein
MPEEHNTVSESGFVVDIHGWADGKGVGYTEQRHSRAPPVEHAISK